jgi:predicted TIM-barrel fold metal-dependent hydrolase
MEIVDAQIHHPEPGVPYSADLPAQDRWAMDVELAIAAMDAVGVDAAVVHSDHDFCEAAILRYPNRFAGVVQFRNPLALESPEEEIATLRRRPGMVGFRLVLSWPPKSPDSLMRPLREGKFEPFFSAAEKHGVPVALFIPEELPAVHAIVRAHPDLLVIIDHIGMLPPPQVPFSDRLLDSLPDLLKLAEYPNLAVKFSRLPGLSAEPYPFSDIWRRAGNQVIEAFTPQRLLWGSDYTRLKGVRTYSELLNFLLLSGEASDADKEEMLSRSARRWFRWPA